MTGGAGPRPDPTIDAVLTVSASGVGHVVELRVRAGQRERTASEDVGGEPAAIADGTSEQLPEAFRVLDRRTPRAAREDAGQRLFAGIFRGTVAELWQDVEHERAAGRRVRLRLDIQETRLAALPWELLRDGSWLSLRANLTLWRGGDPLPPDPPDDGPLRVLLVLCNPLDRHVLGEDEVAGVAVALAGQLALVHVEILDGPEQPKYWETVDRLRPHVLHFIGHGMPRPGKGTALSFNWMPSGLGEGVTMPRSWDLGGEDVENLSDWKPHLVVVNACRTASDPADQIDGFADAFLAAGARAVVSMQADVESPAAGRFSSALYRGLADRGPLDRVLADVRREMARDVGDNGEWALPVLATRTDPADVLGVEFAQPDGSITAMCHRVEYQRLRYFLGRSCERRKAWWALDPLDGEAVRSLLAIGGRSQSGRESTGTTWLTRWCLFTYFLRGHRVTYVDLHREDVGQGLSRNKDWLAALRTIREACTDSRQPEPLSAAAFSGFNAAVNDLVHGIGRSPVDTSKEVADEWRRFDEDAGRAEERIAKIFTEFRGALRAFSDGRPHVIALDHATAVLDDSFTNQIYPRLIRPIADGEHAPIRLILVGSESWLERHLPDEDETLWQLVPLGDFDPAEFMRLAQDFCGRRNMDFTEYRPLFEFYQPKFPKGFPVSLFEEIMRPLRQESVGGRP